MRELTKEMLLGWGIEINEDPMEECGYLIMRTGQYCGRSKVVLKKLTPSLSRTYHPKSGNWKDYYLLGFSVNGKVTVYPLARVIYAWYYGVCPGNMDIDHKDNNGLNNHYDNLQPLTRRDNLAKRTGNVNQFGLRKKDRVKEIILKD